MTAPTPSTNSPRKLAVIQEEYEAMVAQAGERDFRVALLQSEKRAIHKMLIKLNQEAELSRAYYQQEHTNGRHAEPGPHAEPAQS